MRIDDIPGSVATDMKIYRYRFVVLFICGHMCVCSQLMGMTDKYFNNLKARAHTSFRYSAHDSKY
jgi:hypothetical protein